MPRNLTLHPETGQLSAVVESYEQVEMAQLQAEVDSKQAAVDSLQSQADVIATQLSEAQAALDDAKSELSTGQSLVEQPTNDDGSVPVDVTVADTAAQF